ncbi:hypothetical protein V3C99_018443 [Haemonchus contortus]|uniref:Uncharacterized protein n=1 Tax=Haemonchus contortus TaxID=6289 RepID=A0A7I4Z217_HAECO
MHLSQTSSTNGAEMKAQIWEETSRAGDKAVHRLPTFLHYVLVKLRARNNERTWQKMFPLRKQNLTFCF